MLSTPKNEYMFPRCRLLEYSASETLSSESLMAIELINTVVASTVFAERLVMGVF